MISNEIQPNDEQCLEFFYYDDASQAGLLNIYIKYVTQNVSFLGLPLWSEPLVTDNIQSWKMAQVTLHNQISTKNFQIVFEQYVDAMATCKSKERERRKEFGLKLIFIFFLYLFAAKLYNIYLDDVFVRDHSCLPAGDCDFESNNLCMRNVFFFLNQILIYF